MSEIRILQFILTLEQGGAQQMLLDIALQWQHEGIYVSVCTFEDGPIRHKLEANGIEVQILRPKNVTVANILSFINELQRVRAEIAHIIQMRQITILQTHLLSIYDFITPPLLTNCPTLQSIVWTFHNTRLEFEAHSRFVIKKWVYYWLYRRLVKKITCVVAVSKSVQQFLEEQVGIPSSKIITLPNALPIDDYKLDCDRNDFLSLYDLPSDVTLLLTVGRLTEQKGHRYLLDAMSHIIESRQNMVLFIVGEGMQYEVLQAQANDLGISDKVYFLGYRNDVPQLLACADIFVLPSIYEGLPRVILEAMASQTFIVASDISGISDVLQSGVNSRLVPAKNSKALANTIQDVVINVESAKQLEEQAYIDVKANYNIQYLSQQYLDAFQRHLPSNGLP